MKFDDQMHEVPAKTSTSFPGFVQTLFSGVKSLYGEITFVLSFLFSNFQES